MNKVEVVSYIDAIKSVKHKNGGSHLNAAKDFSLPIGVSSGEYQQLSLENNVAICGGTGSGKTTVLENLIASCAVLYTPESLEVTLFDFKGTVSCRFGDGSGIFHPCLKVFNDRMFVREKLMELRNNMHSLKGQSIKKRQLIVFDEISALGDLTSLIPFIVDIMVNGPQVGMHCVVCGQASETLGELMHFCSEKVIMKMSAQTFNSLHLGIPYVSLPLRYGLSTLVTGTSDNTEIRILLQPMASWEEMRKLVRSQNK